VNGDSSASRSRAAANASRVFSLEFFPPRTPEGIEKLRATRRQLAQLEPAFCSVTFGAGGSTREGTLSTVLEFRGDGLEAAPHLSCIGGSCASIAEVLTKYKSHGIHHVVALRGDLPSGTVDTGDFRYASELVAFIRKETGDHFHIDVAAYPEYHPQARSAQDDLDAFKRKIDAGADSAITQYFYNADAYWHFVDECQAAGMDVPIVPGIMPITNYEQVNRFTRMCGATVPMRLALELEKVKDNPGAITQLGVAHATVQCMELLDRGVPGIHFYTLNRSTATRMIVSALRARKS